MLLFAPPHRIVDTDLGRVEIDHPPRDGAMEHLPQRLGCFKAVTGRERHPPLRDLLRRQLTDAAITEHRGRLAEQIAELLDRYRLHVVLREVRLHEFGEREPACDASLTSQPLELALECITRTCSEANPPRWIRFESRPPVRKRYAHSPSPPGPRRVSSIVCPCCTIAGIHSFQESTPSQQDPRSEKGSDQAESDRGGCSVVGDGRLKAAQMTVELRPALASRLELERRAKLLAHLGNGWHLVEFAIALGAGIAAGSVALTGFAGDSLVEVVAASIIVWLFSAGRGASEHAERRAQQLVAVSYLLLVAYIRSHAIYDLVGTNKPATSWIGVGLAAFTAPTMPLLARAKRKVGRALNSAATVSEAGQNQICAYLSLALLTGLLLNALAGWWWADPAAALVIAAVALNEGRESWRGTTCDCC